MKFVTSYPNPDLDGVACTYAFSELKEKMEESFKPVYFGNPHTEASFVMEKLDIRMDKAEEYSINSSEVVIVDVSSLNHIPGELDPENVIEVIDHRKENEKEKFTNAETQIELVGSAATLIAERFKQRDLEVSKESANLLYAAIVSNTLNFEAGVTTERDKRMGEWLDENSDISQGLCREMFKYKSKIESPLKQVFLGDKKSKKFGEDKYFIAQLEIISSEDFVLENRKEILDALEQIKEERDFDQTFLTVADLEKGLHYLVSPEKKARKVLSEALEVEFNDSVAKNDKVLLRKEISPKIREVTG